MNFNPANHLVLSNGAISTVNLMRAAHAKAKREMTEFRASRLCGEAEAKFWTYARHFKEAIQWAWDRAKQMQRLVAA